MEGKIIELLEKIGKIQKKIDNIERIINKCVCEKCSQRLTCEEKLP